MPTLHSHTHLQAAQAKAQTKACKRVCLPHRTTDRQTDDRKEGRTANKVLANMAGDVQVLSFVHLNRHMAKTRTVSSHFKKAL